MATECCLICCLFRQRYARTVYVRNNLYINLSLVTMNSRLVLFLGDCFTNGSPYAMGPLSSVCPVYDVGVLWPNGWMDQDATWYGGKPRPRPYCVRWGPASHGKGHSSPHFWPMSIVAKRSPISVTAEVLFSANIENVSICITVVLRDETPMFLQDPLSLTLRHRQ